MSVRRLLPLLLVFCVAALVPLAHASPPDPTWFGGLYDDGDGDDVVIAVTSAAAVVTTIDLSALATPDLVVNLSPAHASPTARSHAGTRLHTRGPPSRSSARLSRMSSR